MSEDDEKVQNPESRPQAGPNVWDIARITMMPLVGFYQGVNAMFDGFQDLCILQSQVHDEKKALKSLTDVFK